MKTTDTTNIKADPEMTRGAAIQCAGAAARYFGRVFLVVINGDGFTVATWSELDHFIDQTPVIVYPDGRVD